MGSVEEADVWRADMQLGRVMGTATSTVKHPTFQGERLLVVQLETGDGKPDGEPILVFDRLGARRGDQVLCTNDGRALQELLGATTPGRWSVMALPDRQVIETKMAKVGP
jgi:microcompartment protein CcmK/EutM